jgi:hypothetical protein
MTVRCTGMKLLSEVFKSVKKTTTNKKKKIKKTKNKQQKSPCQLVSDLDVVGGS